MEGGVEAMEGGLEPGAAALLEQLGIARHAAALASHSITSAADLQLLSKEDCRELGLSLGERNRVAAWAAAQRPRPAGPSEEEVVRLAARIGELEQDVAEREEWVAASLSAEEMKRRAEAARRRRGPERINVRTRVAPAQVKTKAKQQARKRKKKRAKAQPKAKVAVLANALFANAGTARRIGFAIDISGSMGAPGFGAGQNRLDVVKEHLKGAIGSMEGAFNAAFSIVLFDTNCHTPMGDSLTPATWTGVKKAEACINEMQPGGGNGGEAACMRALLKMGPQAIFFLGDGGWGEQELLAAAGEAKKDGVTVHSIAFFTSGGGLPEIAAMTAGTYREINGPDDLDELPAAKTGPSAAARGGVLPEDEGSESGSSDDDDEDDDDDDDGSDGTGSESSDEEGGGG